MATLRAIAAAAGVHVGTASAVLNSSGGNTRVSPATRRRVLQAAQRLSYVPNELARRLRTGKSNVVGFLGGDLRNPFFSDLTAALEEELARFKLPMVVSHLTQAEPVQIEKTIEGMRQENVRKIICWEESAIPSPRRGRRVEAVLSIGFTRRERPGVWLDLELAMETATEEMDRRGFRRLGFYFPAGQRESPSVAARSQAFVEGCRKRALARPVLASYEGESWDLLASVKGAGRVLEKNPLVEGWIGFNDIAGLGLLRSLSRRDSHRVLCFDGTMLARCWPGTHACLNLKVPEFARIIVGAALGRENVSRLGQRPNWLKPELLTER